MLLSKKTRQKYLKELGFYTGEIDGIIGVKSKAAYKALQDKYFTRAKDRDGLYGKNTDILLRNAYNVHLYCKNFELDEFKCECGGKYCTSYPAVLKPQLLINVQAIRDEDKQPITITSGMRCKPYNNSLTGSSPTSGHMKAKALDIRFSHTKSETGRKKVMAFFKKLKGYYYTYCNLGGSHPHMGEAIHIEVK